MIVPKLLETYHLLWSHCSVLALQQESQKLISEVYLPLKELLVAILSDTHALTSST